jgi:hypothetical protein
VIIRQHWTAIDDALLGELLKAHIPVHTIAATMCRSYHAIQKRAVKTGLRERSPRGRRAKMSKDAEYDAPEVMRVFNELFDVMIAEFANITERGQDVPILESSMGVMMIVFDFRKRKSFLNYKGSASEAEVHRLLRDYLDNPDARRVKP